MAGRLTWQNVDNPDFRGVADSYRAFSELLGAATKSGSQMINTVTDANTQAADRAILQRQLAIQDPAAYQAALAAGTVVGADGSKASLETLRGLDKRPESLLRQAVVGEGLKRESFDNTRYMEGVAALDGKSDVVNMARSLAATGNYGEATKMLLGAGLRQDQHASILGALEGSAVSGLARDVTGQRLTEDRYGFGNEVQANQDSKAGRGLVADIISQYATPDDARPALLNAYTKGDITPEAYLGAIQGLGGMGYGNILAPNGGTGGSGKGGASGVGMPTGPSGFRYEAPQQAVGTALKNSGLPDVVVAGFLGNFHHEGGYGGAKGDGGTAAGIAQWRGDRQKNFKEIIGKDVSVATPEEQARFVKWEMDNPTKAGMSVASRDRILNAKTPQEAAELIDQLYERSDGKARQGRMAAAADAHAMLTGTQLPTPTEAVVVGDMVQRGLTERLSQDRATGISANYDKLQGDTRSAQEVAAGLRDSSLSGTSEGFLLDQINRIVDGSGGRISPAIAGEMINRNIKGADSKFERYIDMQRADLFGGAPSTPNLGGGKRLNDRGLQATVDDYLKRSTSDRAAQGVLNTARQAEVGAATNNYNTTLSQYRAMVLAAATDPRVAQKLPAMKAQLETAKQQMDDVLGVANQDPALRPNFDQTAPPEADNSGWRSGPSGQWREVQRSGGR